MSFKDRGWNARFAEMGDQAEAKFEEVCDRGFVRYGLNRPPLRMSMLPPFVRYTPDYLTSRAFVEVQGFGRDQTFKLKVDKYEALAEWAQQHPVDLFIYDSHNDRHIQLSLDEVYDVIMASGHLDRFPEGKAFWSVPADAIFGDTDAQAA